MRRDVSLILVGALVLGAIVLGTGTLIVFGSLDLFSESSRVVVFIDESVSGLEEGAAVKLRGVRIGEVASLEVVCDLDTARNVVTVGCSIRPGVIMEESGDVIDLGEKEALDALIDKGLRAKVALAGVTGFRFLSLDFYDPGEYPVQPARSFHGAADADLVIPAIPSTISELTKSVAEILSEVRKADISGTATKLTEALGASEKTMESVTELSRSVSRVLADLDGADLRSVVQRFSATLTEAEASLRSMRQTSEDVSWLVGGESGLDRTALDTLEAIGEAARAVERLADYLERHPDALLVGKPHE